MLVMRGGSASVGSMAVLGGRPVAAAVAPAIAARPWELTGMMAVDDLLVWACCVQGAADRPFSGMFEQEVAAAGGTWFRGSSDGCAAAERFFALGAAVDSSRGGGGRVSAVAEAVLASARALPGEGELVIEWARLGVAPDGWAVPARCAWPRHGWAVEGIAAAKVYDYAGPGRSGPSTPVVIVSTAEIAANRARYTAWWDLLELLAWRLSARAIGFVVEGPRAVRVPWESGNAGRATKAA